MDDIRTEYCTIETPVQPVPGNYGPQYQFKLKVPTVSRHAFTVWVDQSLIPEAATAEQREALTNTQHWVTVKRAFRKY